MKKSIFIFSLGVLTLLGCDNGSRSESGSIGGYVPSFTGSGDSEQGTYVLRKVTAYYSNGVSAGRFEVVQQGACQYVRREAGIQKYNINVDYQNGFNYVFWDGSSWLYFY